MNFNVLKMTMPLVLAVLLSGFGLDAARAATTPPKPPAVKLVQIESLGNEEVCGLDSDGKTSCIRGYGEATIIPDNVGTLKVGFANRHLSCGMDEVGIKCWQLPTTGILISGVPLARAYKTFFAEMRLDTIRLGIINVCGVHNKTGELNCIVPYWGRKSGTSFHVKPVDGITAIGVANDSVCWADGTPSHSKIECRTNNNALKWSDQMSMLDVRDLVVIRDYVCARSGTDATCFANDGRQVPLEAEAVTAGQWRTDGSNLCFLTADQRFVCVEPSTGKAVPKGYNHAVPPVYEAPNPDVADIWVSDGSGCVHKKDGSVGCWNWWDGQEVPVKFGRPVVEIFGSSSEPCARLDNGQAECRLYTPTSKTLSSAERVHIDVAGYSANKCFWNSSGVDCREKYEEIPFQSVKMLTSADDALCIIGVRSTDTTGIDTVRCFGYSTQVQFPMREFQNPTLIATNGSAACVTADDGLFCWGSPYAETPMPVNIFEPTKMVMGFRHACLIDRFGLACWGEITALQLDVPVGLEQPGRVIDVAVGSSQTCAVVATADVQCWGANNEHTESPPILTNAKSIFSRGDLFCATDDTGVHCWGSRTSLPK